MTPVHELGARDAAAQIAAGTLSAEALARGCLERIAAREPEVRAWQVLEPARVIAAAQSRDRAPHRGLLHGLPIGVKDVFDTADLPTAYGSDGYGGFRPAADASAVALAQAAGAVVMGKTVTTEFACFAAGPTRNPHNPEHTPGGSSSGSAAAVAAGMVPLALGTQTVGSVIRPASFCGVVGYKPSFGLIDRTGVKALAGSLDTVGLFARAVGDAGLFAAALADRPDLADIAPAPAPRIGVYRGLAAARVEPSAEAALAHAAARARAAGATVTDRPAMPDEGALRAAHATIFGWDMARALAHERLVLLDRVKERTRTQLRDAASVSRGDYDAAQALSRRVRAGLDALFGDDDVLLSYAAPGEAPRGLDYTGDPFCNLVWTLLFVPCVTVPALAGPAGLPVGVQIIGRFGDDARALGAAAFLERTLQPGPEAAAGRG